MTFQFARLRRGEIIAGASAVILLVGLLALPWYGLAGPLGSAASGLGVHDTVTGWTALTTLRWVILVCVAVGLALAYFQGARTAPALPASLSVIATTIGAITSVALIFRVLLSLPGPGGMVSARVGAYVGLLSALALTAGAFRSLREEDPPDPARNASIEVVPID